MLPLKTWKTQTWSFWCGRFLVKEKLEKEEKNDPTEEPAKSSCSDWCWGQWTWLWGGCFSIAPAWSHTASEGSWDFTVFLLMAFLTRWKQSSQPQCLRQPVTPAGHRTGTKQTRKPTDAEDAWSSFKASGHILPHVSLPPSSLKQSPIYIPEGEFHPEDCSNSRREMLISPPKIPRLVHLQWTTPHSAFPSTLQHCMCKQPPGLSSGQRIQGCPAHSPTTRGITQLLPPTSKERKITGRSRSNSQICFSVVLFYELILIFGNTP